MRQVDTRVQFFCTAGGGWNYLFETVGSVVKNFAFTRRAIADIVTAANGAEALGVERRRNGQEKNTGYRRRGGWITEMRNVRGEGAWRINVPKS